MSRTLSMAEARNKLTQLPDEFAQDAETVRGDGDTSWPPGAGNYALTNFTILIVETLEVMSDPELVSRIATEYSRSRPRRNYSMGNSEKASHDVTWNIEITPQALAMLESIKDCACGAF